MGPARRNTALLDDPVRLAAAYESTSIAELAARTGVSNSTVRRALVRHGFARLPRNRNRRAPSAQVLDDPTWQRRRYRTSSGVDIAKELGVAPRTVYSAMERHGIERRTEPGTLKRCAARSSPTRTGYRGLSSRVRAQRSRLS